MKKTTPPITTTPEMRRIYMMVFCFGADPFMSRLLAAMLLTRATQEQIDEVWNALDEARAVAETGQQPEWLSELTSNLRKDN